MTMQLGRRLSGVLATVLLAFGLLAGARIASGFHGELDRAEKPVALPAVPLGRFAEGDLLARVSLPRLRARFEVFEGIETATLARGAGHVPGTSLPGENGGIRHSLVAMPRDTASALAALRLSDVIEMKTPFGTRRYVVISRSVHPAGEIPLAPGSRERVTLVTPYPENPIGPAPLRLAILAEAERAGGGQAPAPLAARRFSLWQSSREWLTERSAAPLRSSQLLDELRDAIHRANL